MEYRTRKMVNENLRKIKKDEFEKLKKTNLKNTK